ncbi:hypothetical protein P4O66_022852 [Electrophorus voltai]|uniref:Peptidoglycan binding-like domain-containing protein n=1 Tax=Electrophorus voltai TaxID=2609070 RepID=A0AAD8ZM03_9TELE|nr:hypothetical protein P4O66_022852 [Electrophorus voltai]
MWMCRALKTGCLVLLLLIWMLQCAALPKVELEKATAYLKRYGYLPTTFQEREAKPEQISEALRIFQKVSELAITGQCHAGHDESASLWPRGHLQQQDPQIPCPGSCDIPAGDVLPHADVPESGLVHFDADEVWTEGRKELWKELPGHLNAAVHSPRTSKSYFLKGKKIWRYSGFKLDLGYPKLLIIPPNIDSAFFSRVSKKLIFIKGSEYWQWDELGSGNVLKYYPKPLSHLVPGLPSNPDAALIWNSGHIYVFKGDQYWRVNARHFIDKGYPRSTKERWMQCED